MERAMRALILLTMGLFAAQAQAQDHSAFRFGIGLGKATVKADDFDLEGSATAREVFGGYEINQYVAVEVGYIDGGTADDTFQGASIESDSTTIAASVLGSLPIGDSASVYARAGLMHWESETAAKVDGFTIATLEGDGDDPFFGVGAAANVEGALVRLEYRMADLDDTDLSLISLAIVWRF